MFYTSEPRIPGMFAFISHANEKSSWQKTTWKMFTEKININPIFNPFMYF